MGEGKVVREGQPHRAAAPRNAPKGAESPSPTKEGGGGRPGGRVKVGVKEGATSLLEGGRG